MNILGYILQVHCPGEEPHDMTVVDHVKVFRNRPDLRFEFRIHEQILPAIRRAGGDVAWTDLYVVHSGAERSPEGRARKLERDFRILHLDLAEHGEHPFVLFNLGMTHSDARQYEEAVDYLRRSIAASEPTESHVRKAYAILASSLFQLERYADSQQAAIEGLALFPSDKELLFRRAMVEHQLGRLESAAATYRRVLEEQVERHFTSVDVGIAGTKARHNLAIVYEDMREWPLADREWLRITADDPTYLPAWRRRGELLLLHINPQAARELALELKRQPATRSVGEVLLARCAEQAGDIQLAQELLQNLLAEEPTALDAQQELCRLLFERGSLDEARSALSRLVELTPDDPCAWHNLGHVLIRLGEFKQAVAALLSSLQLRPYSKATYALWRQASSALGSNSQLTVS